MAKDLTKVCQGSNTSKTSVKIVAIIHFKDKIALLFQKFFDNELLKKSNNDIKFLSSKITLQNGHQGDLSMKETTIHNGHQIDLLMETNNHFQK